MSGHMGPERSLPHSLDAERSVLGAILVDNRALDDVLPVIESDAFYRDAHRRVFDAMVALDAKKCALDFVTVKEELARTGHLDAVGGPAYIASLADGVPRSTNVEYYARVVKEHAIRRSLIYLANKLLSEAFEQEDADVLLEFAEQGLLDLSRKAVPGEFKSSEQLVKEIYPVIDNLLKTKQAITGIRTGFPSLDGLTRGFQRGELWTLAGRTSTGKSTLGFQLLVEAAKSHKVGAFSIEMSAYQQMLRMVASEARVDGLHLLAGRLPQRQVDQVGEALNTLGYERTFWIDDSVGVTAAKIRSKVRRQIARTGLDMVVIDQLSNMKHPDARGESNAVRIGMTTWALKELARELNVVVLLLHQLNRGAEERGDNPPQLSDLKGSGSIEEDSDGVLLLHRRYAPKGKTEVPPSSIYIAKQRNGPLGEIKVRFHGEYYRFVEETDLYDQP